MKKGNFHRGNNAKAAKGSKAKPPPPPPEKYLSWWQTMKSQLHFIMTGEQRTILHTPLSRVKSYLRVYIMVMLEGKQRVYVVEQIFLSKSC